MAPTRQQPPQFSKDEKVLCFHMDMLYEAKVMDVEPAEKPAEGYRYKIHYKGWKNTWDDWVLVDRIRPFDAEHKELAAQLHAQLKQSMQKSTKPVKKNAKGAESSRGSEERGSVAAQGGRGGRRGKDWELEQVSFYCHFDFSFLLLCSPFWHYISQSFWQCVLQLLLFVASSCSTFAVCSLFVCIVPFVLSLAEPSILVPDKLRNLKQKWQSSVCHENRHSLQDYAVAPVKVHIPHPQSLNNSRSAL